ncbi:MAG: DUF5657 family protein [Patescibacteria group bacterium]|nr:hypothetical protein [Patescibacteria group bacterium]
MLWQTVISPNASSIVAPEVSVFLLWFIKWCLIVLAIFYVAFSGVVIRQIQIMRQTLVTSFSPVLKILGFAHFGFALFVLLIFFSIL